ncbi:hypothetical protein [Amycolatopsis sp. Poz14]|uniref:hypothetical protein n=1 Tax=Amycolatopsis sp. Poz14 TaxID=1447705 RepID=UPI001EE8745C|nr:hypothetical protein [Amycolatopsis sp. Poz14]MCG3751969.1 hypothetical protein [Amycolatopsis sp. Poz14]
MSISAQASPLAPSPNGGRQLTATLRREDAAEERAGLSPHDRISCPVHRRWLYQCVSSPAHAIRVTGHRWCRECDAAAAVAVDELTGAVVVTCSRCLRVPDSAANRQLLRACRASVVAARQARHHRQPWETRLAG